MLRDFLFIGLLFCLAACHGIDDFPIAFLGLNEAGEEIQNLISAKRHNKKLGKAFNTLSQETLAVLAHHKTKNPWQLNRVDIGLGVTSKLGFPLLSVEATPSFRLTFKKR